MRVMFEKGLWLAGAAALAVAMAVPAAAQDSTAQDPTVQGAMAQHNAVDLDTMANVVKVYDGRITDAPAHFTYSLAAGKALVIDAVPASGSDVDPMLKVTDADTGEVLAEDDDSGDGVAARVRIHSETARKLAITVSAYASPGDKMVGGAFRLRIETRDYAPAPVRQVNYGDTITGTLQPDETNSFTIQGQGGTELQAMLNGDEGSDLDPVLSLYQGTDTSGDPLKTDDDGGKGVNSLLRYVLPKDGTYTLVASGYQGSGGSYKLMIGPPRKPLVQAPEQQIGFGETLGGRLGEGYKNGGIDPDTITYRLTPEAIAQIRSGNGQVTFNMTQPPADGNAFDTVADPYLELGFDTPLGFATVMKDDDGGVKLDARIPVDLSPLKQGDWLERLRLRASDVGDPGSFEIAIAEGMQPLQNDDNPRPDGEGEATATDHARGASQDDQQAPLVPQEVPPSPPMRAGGDGN